MEKTLYNLGIYMNGDGFIELAIRNHENDGYRNAIIERIWNNKQSWLPDGKVLNNDEKRVVDEFIENYLNEILN